MRRFALLLEASEAIGEKVIDGCKRDAERWRHWLRSKSGGAWNESEVKVIHNPYAFELDEWMPKVHEADFAILSFSGHGRILQSASGVQRQMIVLGNGNEIDFAKLLPRASKKIVVCDACRNIHLEPPPVRYSRKSMTWNLESFTEGYSRAQYRTAYENAIRKMKRGVYRMYSCAPNESVGDDVLNGGYFTDGILSVAADWVRAHSSPCPTFVPGKQTR